MQIANPGIIALRHRIWPAMVIDLRLANNNPLKFDRVIGNSLHL